VTPRPLLAVPNVSEGQDQKLIDELAREFDARLLDVHSDPDHHRSVYTLAARPGDLARAVLAGAREAVRRIDVTEHQGAHPRVGALDVAPIVYLDESDRGAASAEALVLGDMLGAELELPVLLYGALAPRIESGELRADFGPPRLHPTAGAVLVAARPPLVAFNVELAPPATLEQARSIAAAIREGGCAGLESVRAIGVWLDDRGRAQVSTNVENHLRTPLREVVAAVAERAAIEEAELVGLAPAAAFDGFPDEIPVRGRATIEDALLGPV
jgi:glutamate formiminotransferase